MSPWALEPLLGERRDPALKPMYARAQVFTRTGPHAPGCVHESKRESILGRGRNLVIFLKSKLLWIVGHSSLCI